MKIEDGSRPPVHLIDCQVHACVPGRENVKALIDSGASHSLLQLRLLPKKTRKAMIRGVTEVRGLFVSGKSHGWLNTAVTIGGKCVKQVFCVIDDEFVPDVILGMDFLRENNAKCEYNPGGDSLSIGGQMVSIVRLNTLSDMPAKAMPIVATAALDESAWKKELYIQSINMDEPEDVKTLPLDTFIGTPDQKVSIQNTLKRYIDVMVKRLEKAGEAKTQPMKLELSGDAKPWALPPRPLSFHRKKVMKDLMDAYVTNGTYKPCHSEWAAPAHLVLKADGSYRMVTDYRGLNKCLVKDRFPLPRMQDLLDRLKGAKYFSVMDGVEGYHQMPLDEESQKLAAVITPFGTFAPTSVAFGLATAPSHFQREIQKILEKFESFCVVYLDDIIIFSESFEEHLMHLSQVLDALREANLKIKISKCRFAQSEVDFLGHKVTRDGILPSTRKVEALMQMPYPKNVKEVMSFNGLANYFRKFVPNFSTVARPLNDLIKKDTPWKWGAAECEAVDKIRKLITEAPILAYPDLNKPFILETDASGVGIGGVLIQKDDAGVEHPVAFYSASLNPAQRNYSIAEREALAIFACGVNWESYLEGQKEVEVRTDQQALKWIFARQDAIFHDGRTARMVDRIKHLNLKVVYKPGVENGAADLMSRPPVVYCNFLAGLTLDEGIHFEIGGEKRSLREWQDLCPETKALINLLNNPETSDIPDEMKKFKKYVPGLALMRDVLVYAPEESNEFRSRIVAPKSIRNHIMYTFHDSKPYGCHQGRDRTLINLKSRFWWPGMNADVSEYVKSCHVCSERKKKLEKHGLLQNFEFTEQPFDRVGIDWIGPLPESKNGNQYVLVIVDHFSHYPLAVPTKRNDAATLVKCLQEKLEAEWGPPKTILSDMGSDLRSELAKECYRVFGSVKLSTTAYHPQTNGLVERFNGTFKRTMAKLIAEDPLDWEEVMMDALSIYRKTPHSVLGLSPHEILYNVPPKFPFDHLWVESKDREADEEAEMVLGESLSAHMEHRRARRERIRNIMKVAQREADAEMKSRYDKDRVEVTYEVGDQVWWLNKPILVGGPFLPIKKGPFTVIRKGRTPNNYSILIGDKEKVLNVKFMEKYVPPRESLPPLEVITSEAPMIDESHKSIMEVTKALPNVEVAKASSSAVKPSPVLTPIALSNFAIKDKILKRGMVGQKMGGKNIIKFVRPVLLPTDELQPYIRKYSDTECDQLLTLVFGYLKRVQNNRKRTTIELHRMLISEFMKWDELVCNAKWIRSTLHALKDEVSKSGDTVILEQVLTSMIKEPTIWFMKQS